MDDGKQVFANNYIKNYANVRIKLMGRVDPFHFSIREDRTVKIF